MKKIFTTLVLYLFYLSVIIAQDTVSLEEAGKLFSSDEEEFPENVSFVKDTNNTLSKFLVTWSGTLNQKKLSLYSE